MKLAYSLHLGSDKNKKNVSRATAKSNASGTTSLSNNAIQNAQGLSRVDKHNYRKYDDKEHLIEIVRGTTSLYDDVKNLYKDEFEEASDLACEIIIELEKRSIGIPKIWNLKNE